MFGQIPLKRFAIAYMRQTYLFWTNQYPELCYNPIRIQNSYDRLSIVFNKIIFLQFPGQWSLNPTFAWKWIKSYLGYLVCL